MIPLLLYGNTPEIEVGTSQKESVQLNTEILEEAIKNMPPPPPSFPAILEKVAKCESGQRQFNKDGSVLRGRAVAEDVGYMQINEYYHLKESIRLGYNIYTLEGNKAYGLYLYKTQGLQPWSASKHCWSK